MTSLNMKAGRALSWNSSMGAHSNNTSWNGVLPSESCWNSRFRSPMRYKGVHGSSSKIARELGVDALIEGSVLHAGGRVRITAQLIDAATDTNIWAQSYERELCDILA